MSFHIKVVGITKSFANKTSGFLDLDRQEKRAQRGSNNSVVALNGVTLEITNGERVGIIGPNGAGKSTLLHLIAGITTPTGGSIKVNGRVTAVMTLGIGLRDEATGRENIYLDGEVQGLERKQIDVRISEVIAFADIGKFIDYPVRTYSTGMKARLAFSMITHLEPEILIIDEALSAGDAVFAAKATRRIKELCQRGNIVIIVSHGMGTINEICDRCIWMDAGRIAMDGKPDQVTKAYVQTVLEADEKELLEKFGKKTGIRSLAPGWALNGPEVLVDGRTSLILTVGADTSFTVRGEKPDSTSTVTVAMSIIRLDGILLFDQSFLINNSESDYAVHVRMNPLILGAGTYRINIKALEDGVLKAEVANIFKVVHPNAPAGGKPMLFPVVNARVTVL